MSYHQVEQATEKTTAAHGTNSLDQETIAQRPIAVTSLNAMAGDPNTQAANLHQQTNGNLARAGNTLLQLQNKFGNYYVQRLINPQQRLTVQPGMPSWHSVFYSRSELDITKLVIESLNGKN